MVFDFPLLQLSLMHSFTKNQLKNPADNIQYARRYLHLPPSSCLLAIFNASIVMATIWTLQ